VNAREICLPRPAGRGLAQGDTAAIHQWDRCLYLLWTQFGCYRPLNKHIHTDMDLCNLAVTDLVCHCLEVFGHYKHNVCLDQELSKLLF